MSSRCGRCGFLLTEEELEKFKYVCQQCDEEGNFRGV